MTTTELLHEFDLLPEPEKIKLAATIESRLQLQLSPDNDRRATVRRLRGSVRWLGAIPDEAAVENLRDEYLAHKFT